MTSLKILSHLLILVTICLGCNSDIDKLKPINGNVIMFGSSVKETRAVANINNIKSEGFKVWGGYNTIPVFNGEEIVFGSNDTHTTNKYWTDNTYSFYAVYPKNIDANYIAPSSFSLNSYEVNPDVDLMIARVDEHVYPNDGPIVDLPFKHVLSAVSFSVYLNDNSGFDYKNIYKMKSITIGNVYTMGDFTMGSDNQFVATPQGSIGETNPINKFSGENFTKDSPMTSVLMMTMPQTTTTASLTLEIEVNGNTITLNKTDFNIVWKSGIQYNYELRVDPLKDLSITVITTEWEVPNVSNIEIQ